MPLYDNTRITLPSFASNTPLNEITSGSAGAQSTMSRGDHQHPRLSATANGTLDSNGEAVITFTRTFSLKPAVAILLIESSENMPIFFKVKSWTTSGTDYIGCIIKGYRGQSLPSLSVVSGILTAVITGVNAIVSALTGFNVFNGVAAGAEYSFIAIQPS